MLVDYHNHTTLCHHATGTMEEYIEQARLKGIDEFGFSEHSPWMIQEPGEPLAMSYEEVPIYVERVQSLQDQYANKSGGKIQLRLGIEVDYVPSRIDIAGKYLSQYPFDYHIGSVHHLGEWGFDNPDQISGYQNRGIASIYEQYYSLICDMVKTGLIDIIGHFDLPKKFGHRFEPYNEELVNEALKTVQQSGVAVEINAAGWDKPIRECYPSFELIKQLHLRKIPFTLGSDAHAPGEVGRYFPRIISYLREIGVTHLMSFNRRQRIPVPID